LHWLLVQRRAGADVAPCWRSGVPLFIHRPEWPGREWLPRRCAPRVRQSVWLRQADDLRCSR
jgi:hypothetical protein